MPRRPLDTSSPSQGSAAPVPAALRVTVVHALGRGGSTGTGVNAIAPKLLLPSPGCPGSPPCGHPTPLSRCSRPPPYPTRCEAPHRRVPRRRVASEREERFMEREGQVRAEYQEWFPELRPGVWYPAAELARTVREQVRSGQPRWTSEERVPSDRHFVFRGGEGPREQRRHSRHADPSAPSA